MNSSSNIYRSLRRFRPDKYAAQVRPRDRAALTFIDSLKRGFPKLLLDTTVYIDELQGHFPRNAEIVLRASELWHSTVTEAELTVFTGLLDPVHVGTPSVVKQVALSIEKRPDHRILNPDRHIWREAGVLAGLLARLQQYGRSERRRVLNDALIFLSAAKHGCAVLTRNVADFDLLMQLAPFGKAIFYEKHRGDSPA